MREKIIRHTSFGKGVEVEKGDKYIKIRFENETVGQKSFMFPDAFSQYLTYEDENLQQETMLMLQQNVAEGKARIKEIADTLERERLSTIVPKHRAPKPLIKKTRVSKTAAKV